MQNDHQFDAIVVGAGLSGGWVAKELCDKGIKTLLLDRGKPVEHLKDYPTTNKEPWEFPHRGSIPHLVQKENPVVSRCYAFREDAQHFFVKDQEHPYVQAKPFDWIRGYQVGGKSLLWARYTQRWSAYDFEGPARDGFAVDWPIRYADLAPWYTLVEHFAGIAGNKDGLDILPDGDFLPPWPLNCVETHFQEVVKKHYTGRYVIASRCAHLTQVRDIHIQQGRSLCQARNLCQRGCPFGGYFSSVSSVIPWAQKTGHLTLKPNSTVHSVIFDDKTNKATGVRVVDTLTKETTEYFARVIFLSAATLNSNLILLNSTSSRFPQGLGNDSGILGTHIAFHNYRARISARFDGFEDKKTTGGRANSAYLPRFRNVKKQDMPFLRGYASTFSAGRSTNSNKNGVGDELLKQLMEPVQYGDWYVGSQMMGETIPKATNKVTLDNTQKDVWGIPLLKIDVDYDDNDEKMIQDFREQFTEMYEKAGFSDIQVTDSAQAPGLDIHEMGGVRMGRDPQTSMLNSWNQLHTCPNVYVTDGACMTSVSTQNPSLTFMALSARAANHAVEQLKKQVL